MRAIRHDGRAATRWVLDVKAEMQAPGPGEVLIRPTRVALGPRDAAERSASDAARPFTVGREFVGIVDRMHEGTDKEQAKRWMGKRVVGSALIVCGRCDMCRGGLPTHCRERRRLGEPGCDGCLAERFVLPLRNLVEMVKEVDDDRAVFAGALSAAAHVPQLLRVEGKPYVTVLGDSAEALLTAQVMARLNASVRLLGIDPTRFSLCEKWGIKHRHMAEVGRRADQDIVVDWTGSPDGLDLALHLARPRGKVVLGAACAAPCVAMGSLVENEIELIGARGGSVADAVGYLARGEIDVLPLLTRRMRLADGAEVMRAAAAAEQIRVVAEI